ncbi:hypothetical protein T484DRAFT_1755100 [Baffinella frigidus]|nr:hypothetical protein T484DRAFT_1755100 [Cryptophyta sp. CCMP2293]
MSGTRPVTLADLRGPPVSMNPADRNKSIEQYKRELEEQLATKKTNDATRVDAIYDIINRLHRQEDALVDDDPTAPGARKNFQKQHLKMHSKLLDINPYAGPYQIKYIEASREAHTWAQRCHNDVLDLMWAHSAESLPIAQEIQDNFITNVTSVRDVTRNHLAGLFLRGKLSLTSTRTWIRSMLRESHSYNETHDAARLERSETFLLDIIQGKTEAVIEVISALVTAFIVNRPANQSDATYPETFLFDSVNIQKMQRSFKLQVLVVSTVSIIRKIPILESAKELRVFNILEEISKQITDDSLRRQDIKELTTIAHTILQSVFRMDFVCYDTLFETLSVGLADPSGPYYEAHKTLAAVAHGARAYHAQFGSVAATVRTFKKFKIPLEAHCIAPLLHKQGVLARSIIKVQEEYHSSRYIDMLSDASIELLYEYP